MSLFFNYLVIICVMISKHFDNVKNGNSLWRSASLTKPKRLCHWFLLSQNCTPTASPSSQEQGNHSTLLSEMAIAESLCRSCGLHWFIFGIIIFLLVSTQGAVWKKGLGFHPAVDSFVQFLRNIAIKKLSSIFYFQNFASHTIL